MIEIEKFPIIIISSPRTGSTPLAYELKNKYNLELFNEPLPNKEHEQHNFLTFIKNNDNNFILKLHINDLHGYPNDILKIINDHQCTLIRIRRRDIVSQVVSLYIETERDIWGYYKDYVNPETINKFTNSEIPIKIDLIMCIKKVIDINNELNKLTYVFDHDVWYEDLIFKDQTFITTPKPNNYNLIKEAVKTYIEQGKI